MGTTHEESEVSLKTEIEYSAEGLRDPFEPYIKKEEKTPEAIRAQAQEAVSIAPPSLTIQGIIWGGSFNQAIINNKVVKEGDTIEGTQIIKIEKNGITVLYGGREFILSSPAQINLQSLPKEPEGGQYEAQF